LRIIVLESDTPEDELSSILDASSLLEDDEILIIITPWITHTNQWSIRNGKSLHKQGDKRKR
jgi:hypothetical protein